MFFYQGQEEGKVVERGALVDIELLIADELVAMHEKFICENEKI